jgi:hypothetical protein
MPETDLNPTYEMELSCSNCANTYDDYEVPVGTLISDFAQKTLCQFCECKGTLFCNDIITLGKEGIS